MYLCELRSSPELPQDLRPELDKAVDAEKGTITLPGARGKGKDGKAKPDRVFALAKKVKLTLDGKEAELADIKAKMWVGGRAKRLSETSVEAVTVNVKTKRPERKKKPAKKKPAKKKATKRRKKRRTTKKGDLRKTSRRAYKKPKKSKDILDMLTSELF